MKTLACLALGSLVVMWAGCALVESDPFAFDTARIEAARIVLGESIDGVKPGATTDEVERTLGPPHALSYGDFAGFLYEYGAGSQTSAPTEMEILFGEEFEDRVLLMTVRSPYPGTTRERIGVGSRRQEVRRRLGQPDAEEIQAHWKSLGRPWFRGDIYTRDDAIAFVFHYDEGDRIDRIEMLRLAI